MTYQETIDWMFLQLPMYQQKGKIAFNAKLDNIKLFSKHLENPHKQFKSIHVAGTNGKGSSSHMLASILQEAGYKVGLYTSPHLKDYRERIKINGQLINKEEVVKFISNNKSFFEKHQLSFFEMTVGMAFQYFASHKVDVAVIEVGLGGRLDSTNIITPEISLITNIGFDHVDILGATLKEIATEKAGIIKKNIPVVISESQKETKQVFRSIAKKKTAPINFAEELISKNYRTELLGDYQKKNCIGVVATIKNLDQFEVSEQHIKDGLLNVVKNTQILGRWQIIKNNPTIICDTAHNKEGLTLILNQLKEQKYNDLHIVLGFVKGKDIEGVLPLFPKDATYYFTQPEIKRGLNVTLLEKYALEMGLKGRCYKSVKNALKAANKGASKQDLIFVGGSTFIVAEVL